MASENVQADEINEPAGAVGYGTGVSSKNVLTHATCPGDVPTADALTDKVVAFKFGGSSLLGADRMLHAASIVRSSAQTCSVVVIVSAMKGVTDRLLAVGSALEHGQFAVAREEVDGVINVQLGVVRDLQLEERDELRVRREMQSLCRDLLHDVDNYSRPLAGTAELLDRLASYGERLSARLFAAALEKSDVAAVPVSSSDFVRTCETFRDAR